MDGFHLRDSDVFDDWQRSEQDLHRRDLATILERLGAVMSRQGAWDRAVRAGRRWLELDPLHEPAHRLLMTIHLTAGEPAAAVQQYRECVAVLDRELGVAPLPETTALYEQIRTGTFEARSLVPSDARDAIRLDGTAATRPNVTDLPLVGRDESVRTALAAHDRAATSGCVVALVGEAGIGKTRLGSTIVARIRSAGGRALAASPYSGEEGIAFGSMLALLRSGLTGADADRRLAALPPSARRELARLGLDALDAPSPDRSQPTIASHLAFLDGLVTTVDALLEGPVAGVLWLDGVESVDASTLEVLGYLLRRLERRRWPLRIHFHDVVLTSDGA